MLAELKCLNSKIPKNKRIPYNMTKNSLGALIIISNNFKNIRVYSPEEKEKILIEFNNNRSNGIYPLLGVDTTDYVFGITLKEGGGKNTAKKHKSYVQKLSSVPCKKVPYIERVVQFLDYYHNNKWCREKISAELKKILIDKKIKDIGFVSFHFEDEYEWPLHEDNKFIEYVSQKPNHKFSITCSICGKNDYPVADIKTPKVFSADGAMSSFNFKSGGYPSGVRYGDRNTRDSTQAGVCKKCFFEAFSAIQYLLYNGEKEIKEKNKCRGGDFDPETYEIFKYTNRRDFAHGEKMVFWAEESTEVPEITNLEEDRAFKFSVGTIVPRGKPSMGRELDSPKRGEKNIHRGNPDAFYMFSVRKEKGALPVFSPKIGSISQLRKNLKKWEEDVVDTYNNKIPKIYSLAQSIVGRASAGESANTDILNAQRLLYSIAIENIPLNYSYISTIINRYLYGSVWIYTTRALLNLIRRNKAVIDERYKKIGEVFSLMGTVRYKAKSTGQEKFEETHLPSVLRSPRTALARLFEENTFHIQKIKEGGSWYDGKIKQLIRDINIPSLPQITNSIQQANILSGYVDCEVARMEFSKNKKDGDKPEKNNTKNGKENKNEKKSN